MSGSGQYASVPDNNNAFDYSSTWAFTISAWVPLSGTISNNSTYYPIVSHGTGGDYWELSLRGNGATVYNGVYLDLDGTILKPTWMKARSSTMAPGTWSRRLATATATATCTWTACWWAQPPA